MCRARKHEDSKRQHTRSGVPAGILPAPFRSRISLTSQWQQRIQADMHKRYDAGWWHESPPLRTVRPSTRCSSMGCRIPARAPICPRSSSATQFPPSTHRSRPLPSPGQRSRGTSCRCAPRQATGLVTGFRSGPRAPHTYQQTQKKAQKNAMHVCMYAQ